MRLGKLGKLVIAYAEQNAQIITPKLFKLIKLTNHNLQTCRTLFSIRRVADVSLTRERADGTYLAYFPFALTTEAAQMRPYHAKEFSVRSREMWCETREPRMGHT